MAVSRYDQRKNLQAHEANAIGTEYVRTDLLPAQDQTKVRDLLRRYVDQRIQYYRGVETTATSSDSLKLQAQLWSSVVTVGIAQPTPVVCTPSTGCSSPGRGSASPRSPAKRAYPPGSSITIRN
jgi:hypothetical protein